MHKIRNVLIMFIALISIFMEMCIRDSRYIIQLLYFSSECLSFIQEEQLGGELMKIDSAMPIFDMGLFKNTNMGKQKDEIFNNKLKINEKEKSFSEMLQEQILKLKERKENVQNNEKFTVEEKKYKLDEINTQLNELESQLLQANLMEKEKELEEKNDKLREANEKNQELQEELNGDIKKDGIIIAKSLVKLINSNNYIEDAHELNITKESMKTCLLYTSCIL